MAFNGSGTFLINTAGQPVVSGTVISSTAFNALTADLATGLSTAITKDGQTTVTANIPMSTYKFTGLGVGSAATDSANLSQVQSTVTKLLNSVSGADTITATASPTLAAYAAGQMFYFVAAGDNTTSVTLNIDALGAKAVTRDGSVALAAADIKSGEVIVVVYDGTRFQVVSQLNSAGDARFANVSIASSLYVGGVSTFVGNAGFSANVSITSALSVGGVAAITGATTIGGNLTLSGGTANGVLYLNGSKVATSGTALVFDGTNLGVGAASGTSSGYATAPQLLNYSASATNLLNASDTSSIIRSALYRDNTGGGIISMAKFRGTYASPAVVQSGDTSGRLFFDVWGGSNLRRIAEVGALVDTYTSDTNISGTLYFATSTSGNSSSTEKMRLTAAGDLGIGTASPVARLDVSTSLGSTPSYSVNALTVRSTATAGVGVGPSLMFSGKTNNSTADYAFAAMQGIKASAGAGDYSGSLLFYLQNSGGSALLDEQMRLTSTGLGIGTASPSVKLEVNGQIRTEAPTGGTAANWRLGTVHTVSPTSPNRTIEVDIGGTIYYLHAKTTNN